jgi:hypothetical protein
VAGEGALAGAMLDASAYDSASGSDRDGNMIDDDASNGRHRQRRWHQHQGVSRPHRASEQQHLVSHAIGIAKSVATRSIYEQKRV